MKPTIGEAIDWALSVSKSKEKLLKFSSYTLQEIIDDYEENVIGTKYEKQVIEFTEKRKHNKNFEQKLDNLLGEEN